MVFGNIWNFVKRHKNKIVFTGAIVGGLVFLNSYARRKMREWEENETTECFERLRKEQHFESTRITCRTTILALLPSLQNQIVQLANCELKTELLKNKPPNKLKLWNELKCTAFTRIVATMYGCSLLVTALNVQLSIIGGYMYVHAMSTSSSEKQEIQVPLEVQQKYLTLVHNFLGVGCEKMINAIETTIAKCVQEIPLKEEITLLSIQGLFGNIRREFEVSVKASNTNSLDLFSFLLPEDEESEGAFMMSNHELVFNRLMNETRDLFESDECKSVLFATLESVCSYLLDMAAFCFVKKDNIGSGAEFINPNTVAIPLAKLIPVLSGLIYNLLGEHAETLISRLFSLDAQKILGANIYEAFSQSEMIGKF